MTTNLPPLPPRCKKHHDHQRGCPECKEYARVRVARRSRLRAYGRWQSPGQADAAPVREHLRYLHDEVGMSYPEIARLAGGVSLWSIQRIAHDRVESGKVWASTAQKLLAVQPVEPTVPGIGAQRRLQALACAGYTILDLKPYYQGRGWIRRLFGYRQGVDRLPRSSHQAIARMYAELWDTHGPHYPRQAVWARNRGWHPFEAWTDETIDDPDAEPYAEADSYVDEVKLVRVRQGKATIIELTHAEQLVLLREHLAEGRSPRMFAHRYRPANVRADPQVGKLWRQTMRRLRAEIQKETAGEDLRVAG